MKKLTLALLSLMLFLGMGTAFAQTLPTPTFTPSSGSTQPTSVAPGEEITFTLSKDLWDDYGMVYILYTFLDEMDEPELEATSDELTAWGNYIMGDVGGFASPKAGDKPNTDYEATLVMDDGEGEAMFTLPITVPEDAEGYLFFYARLAAEGNGSVEYSNIVSAIYSVESEVEMVAPTFNPAAGAVEPGTTVTINTPEGADFVWYTTTDDGEPTMDKYDVSWFEYTKPIVINKQTTLRAVSVKGHMPPFTFSEVAEATYTVTGEATNIPKLTLNPTGTVSVNGSAVFSCTLEPQTYTHSSGKVGFGISFKNGKEVENLEYQVGTEVDENNWTAYRDQDLAQIKTGTILGAIPSAQTNNASSGRVVTLAATTVHYRLTLSANATTEPEAVFTVVELTSFGTWPTADVNTLTDASVKFKNAKPAAPVFNPNGGEIASDAPIALTTTSTDATIYYTMGDASAFDGIKTQEDLDRAMLMQYFDDEQPTLEMFGMEEAGDEVMLAAAAAFIDEDGNITWSAVTTATFTVAGGEEPAITVEQPVITPGTAEGVIALNQKVKIECATEGAEIYYTTDGKAPYTADNDGNPVAVADNAIKYTAPFSVPEGKKVDDELSIRAVAVKDGVFSIGARANLMIEAAVVVAAPTFEPAAGEVAFGTVLVLNSADEDAVLYYTTDGTEPTEESAEFNPWWDEIAIWKSMTVKAIAVVDGIASEVATAVYTVAPVENATLTLEPMKEDTVGKNVGTGISFTDGTAESERWIQNLPATVYYTTDGTTVPSKAAYEAQADKDNGAIKMVAVKWEDQYDWYGPVQDGEGNLLSLTFTEATHLKAIGCLMDGDEVLITTALLDTMLNIKAEANATFSLADYSKVAVGDKLVIENPNYYDEFDMEMPAWPEDYFDNEESAKAYDEAMAKYDEAYAAYAEEIAKLPQTELYFSFDGTKPTVANRYADDLNVFSMRAGGNVEITFAQDETGYYAYIPAVRGYNSPDDTVRLGEDGILSVQVLCVTTETATEEGGDPMPLSARWGRPGGAAPFVYGSDFTVATYAVKDILIAAPTFSVKAGEVEKGTKVELACETEGAVIYYTVDGAEPTAESTEYKEAITIDKAMTVKAIAIKGDFKSEVATAAYTVKETANEDEELAGVSVYPNPSNGLFNIELPVAATIEVFASNGVLTQRVNAGAGNATLNINRSGIYFLRITGEGRTAIKRIIVR